MDIIGLLDKYAPWSEAPENAEWRAMDANGQFCFFLLEPTPQGEEWIAAEGDNIFSFAYALNDADRASFDNDLWTMFIDKRH